MIKIIAGSFVFVFFFKQKTAYEMRISDWSSDVCSSDLITNPAHLIGGPQALGEVGDFLLENGKVRVIVQSGLYSRDFGVFADRQSVVSGKSVSVRVDLGGRRILKKKKHIFT